MSTKNDLEKDSIASHIIPSFKTTLILVIFAFFFQFFPSLSWLSIFPFILLCIKGIHCSIVTGLILAIIWGGYLMLLFSPLTYFSYNFLFLALYSPLLFILLKDMKSPPSYLVIVIQYLIYEIPLLLWMNLLSYFGYRALMPFYSQITDNIAIGSMPFSSDVELLKSKNVCGVVNLCYEYSGPIREYSQHEISHLHLPTLDIHDPSFEHMKLAIQFIDNLLTENPTKTTTTATLTDSSNTSNKVVFIHCKGGRGRAVITCLCYLISKGYNLQESFNKIKSCRSVASEAVIHSPVVKKFVKLVEFESR